MSEVAPADWLDVRAVGMAAVGPIFLAGTDQAFGFARGRTRGAFGVRSGRVIPVRAALEAGGP